MTEQSGTAVRVRRTIAAPPGRVYRAWLDPELMGRWFAPAPAGTELELTHERLDGLRERHPEIADNVDVGWASALDAPATIAPGISAQNGSQR